MLYWICPECGHECSPAIRECPTCTAAEQAPPAPPAAQTSADILTLAHNFEPEPALAPSQVSAPAPAAGLLSTASYRSLVSATNGHSAPVSTAAVADEDTVELVLSPADRARLASMVKPLVESAKPREPEAIWELAPLDGLAVKPSRAAIPQPPEIEVSPAVSPASPRMTAPAVVAAEIPQFELSLQTANLAPSDDIAFQPSPAWMPTAQEQEAEPVPSRRRSVAFVRGAMPGVTASELGLAGRAQTDEVFQPAAPGASVTEPSVAALPPKAGSMAFLPSKIDLAGASLTEILRALEKSAEELEQAAIRAVQASFAERPAALLLSAPAEIVSAPAPPAEQWMRSPKLVFTPRAPANADHEALSAGPQTPTLAGPCLPPQLRNFAENQNLNRGSGRKRAPAPTWMVSVLVAMLLFLGAGSLLNYLTANRDTSTAAAAPASPRTSAPAPAPASPVAQEHPGARFVEVAGVRVVSGANKRPQLQYIVVNHSAGELSGLNIHIAVHSADSPTGAPLFAVTSSIASLAANQSKEIRSDLDPSIKAASIPDWQSLRTDVLIARQ